MCTIFETSSGDQKKVCWRKKVKAAVVDFVAEGNLELETESIISEDNILTANSGDLEEAEIRTKVCSNIIGTK